MVHVATHKISVSIILVAKTQIFILYNNRHAYGLMHGHEIFMPYGMYSYS